jgi:CLIP-associating protein 1/2
MLHEVAQCLQYLIQLRLTHPTLPLRQYMPSLLALLEDSDPSIREQAKEGIITLFTDSGVPDAARQDLKAQLTSPKTGVRKTTADYVLSKLFGRKDEAALPGLSRASSSSSVATSLDSVEPVYVVSARDLEKEFAAQLPIFEGKETEHNWQAREKAIQRVRGTRCGKTSARSDVCAQPRTGLLKGRAPSDFPDAFLQGLKSILEGISKAVRSPLFSVWITWTRICTARQSSDNTGQLRLRSRLRTSTNTSACP